MRLVEELVVVHGDDLPIRCAPMSSNWSPTVRPSATVAPFLLLILESHSRYCSGGIAAQRQNRRGRRVALARTKGGDARREEGEAAHPVLPVLAVPAVLPAHSPIRAAPAASLKLPPETPRNPPPAALLAMPDLCANVFRSSDL
ncbi:hypothetical protein KM043_001410 [Ampulex compressa]|nr:hypothetical protein KM043_001410 [Ampulex compressa]